MNKKTKNNKINFYNLETKEANDLKIFIASIERIFLALRRKSDFQNEKEWKDLFSEKVILNLDEFLQEISDEVGLSYTTDMRIEELREYIKSSKILTNK